jgi:L-ascorbate metabolism protein UlaG (beta-lactamase superfamily)
MRPSPLSAALIAVALMSPFSAALAQAPAQQPAGCTGLVPAAMGGPIPTDRNLIMLRWLSTANYELTYRGRVYLLDAYFDRGPRNRPTGVVPSEVKRADAIFIGHAHFDHMSDAVPIARRMKAPVYGAKITIDTADALGLPADLGHVVADGDALKFPGMTVEAALARHSTLKPEVLAALHKVFELDAPPETPEELAAAKEVRARGSFAPEVITQGTIAYAFIFDTGFKLLWLDSAGPVTDGDRALARKLGPVDIAIVAYQGHPVAETQIPYTLDLVKLFKPRLYLPAHHDEIFGSFVDLGVEPLFEAIQRALPGTRTIAPLHQRPLCFDIAGAARAKTN